MARQRRRGMPMPAPRRVGSSENSVVVFASFSSPSASPGALESKLDGRISVPGESRVNGDHVAVVVGQADITSAVHEGPQVVAPEFNQLEKHVSGGLLLEPRKRRGGTARGGLTVRLATFRSFQVTKCRA